MPNIKSAREIALEKSKKIERLSAQEMSEIKQQEKIDAILAQYYKDQIESDDLWYRLKGISSKYLLKAQNNFLQSLTFQSNDYDIKKRRTGILAIENLKESNQSSDIEYYLQQLIKIKDEFIKNKEQLRENLQKELARDPQKRFQTFQQGNQIIVKQLSLEEALDQNQQLKQHMQQTEKQFNFAKEKLSDILNKG